MTTATTATTDRVVTVRAKAFTGGKIETVRCIVDADGTVRVWDSVAGYYTTCHILSESAQLILARDSVIA
jgi:hypothetical protein